MTGDTTICSRAMSRLKFTAFAGLFASGLAFRPSAFFPHFARVFRTLRPTGPLVGLSSRRLRAATRPRTRPAWSQGPSALAPRPGRSIARDGRDCEDGGPRPHQHAGGRLLPRVGVDGTVIPPHTQAPGPSGPVRDDYSQSPAARRGEASRASASKLAPHRRALAFSANADGGGGEAEYDGSAHMWCRGDVRPR
jgi:hypothetical protein